MAFIIDVYTSIEDSVTKEKEEKEALIMFGDEAIKFDEERLQIEAKNRF